ncbi:MAG: type III pantothenate kinase [Candidatus Marinimicrobia bacterium]|nr:type III pantothenate kinase [Candidatus Neomarinimicrobiota bacterium]
MLLAIDIGNTNVVLGIIQDKEIITQWRLTTSHMRTRDEFWVTVKLLAMDADVDIKSIDDVIISSVVPPLADQFVLMCRKHLKKNPLIIRHDLIPDLAYDIDNPAELGADRLCDIMGALNHYPLPQIIVDMGTATTFDVISKEKHYLGGSIMPGVETASSSLITQTAKLPKVNFLPTKSVLGKNTIEHLQAGIFWGAVDQIDAMIRRIKKETQWNKVSVIATGGISKLLAKYSDEITDVAPNLTLFGMAEIYKIIKK